MSGLLLSGCCNPCAGGGNDPCRDEFEDYYNLARYEYADTPGGAASVALVERHKTWASSQWVYELELSGDGSFTVEASAPTGELTVGTKLNPSTVDAGVIVRRADSADNISLVYVGSDDHELRQGSTVLATVNFNTIPGFRLVLRTPLSTTTDIEVWGFDAITGDPVLHHTESAVTWVPPDDVWNVGLVTEGANSQFLYFEGSPCPRVCDQPPVCIPAQELNNPAPVPPISWTCEFPEFSREVDCAVYPESFTLIPDSYVWAVDIIDPLPTYGWVPVDATYVGVPWADIFDGDEPSHQCFFAAVNESGVPVNLGSCGGPTLAGYPTVYEDRPAGAFAVKYVGDCGDPNPTITSFGEFTYWPFSPYQWGVSGFFIGIFSRNFGDIVSPDWRFKIAAYYGMTANNASFQGGVLYASDWAGFSTNDYIEGSFYLAKVREAVNCTATPGTLTVTAHRPGSVPIDRRVLQCHDPACEPPVTPVPGQAYCMSVTLADEDDRIISYSVPMGVSYNETTGSWEWTGFIDPWEHPTCGTIPLSSYKIHCVEPQEGAAKQWVLDITTTNGTSRIPLSDDPQFGPVFDGTVNSFCPAETWDAFAIFPSVLDDTADIFGCVDTSCSVEGYCISGVASCETGTCASNSYGNHLGATSSNPPGVASKIGSAFTGPYPIAVPAGYRVWLWKDGGGIHLGVYNGTTLIEEATPLDIDCGQGAKTFGLSDVTFACCAGFGGVVITLIPCGGPIVHV